MSQCSFTDTATVPEMESWLTGTTEATNCVQAALVAGVGLLAFIYVCKTDGCFQMFQSQQMLKGGRERTCAAGAISHSPEATPTARHTSVRANCVLAVLPAVAPMAL